MADDFVKGAMCKTHIKQLKREGKNWSMLEEYCQQKFIEL
jgi:hypothetical protein